MNFLSIFPPKTIESAMCTSFEAIVSVTGLYIGEANYILEDENILYLCKNENPYFRINAC